MKQIGNMHHSITIEFVKIEQINYSTSFPHLLLFAFPQIPIIPQKKLEIICSTVVGEQILPYQWSSDIGDNGVTNEKFVVA